MNPPSPPDSAPTADGTPRVPAPSPAPAPAPGASCREGASTAVQRPARWPWIAVLSVIVGGLGGAGALRARFGGGEARPFASPRTGASPVPAAPGSGDAVPVWAEVSADQIAEAKRLGVPVAFENGIGMRFVLVPAGTFTMGSSEGEQGHQPDETQHRVTLTQAYYVSIHETTNGQYRRFERDHDSGKYEEVSLNADAQPAVRVSHTDATEFATWLSGQEGGRAYRLPTESEWEHAARAKTATSRYWGDDEGGFARNANIADAKAKAVFGFSWSSPWDDGSAATSPVGTFLPNGWGLYDMIGNVWEWCADQKADYPTESVTDPTGPSFGTGRVLRGGSWNSIPDEARAVTRGVLDPAGRFDAEGFRLVAPARPSR